MDEMPDRSINREQLEVQLTTILLLARPILLLGGLALLIYAAGALIKYPVGSGAALIMALFLFLLNFSYRFICIVARLGALLATMGQRS
jgi:hypothetical protein